MARRRYGRARIHGLAGSPFGAFLDSRSGIDSAAVFHFANGPHHRGRARRGASVCPPFTRTAKSAHELVTFCQPSASKVHHPHPGRPGRLRLHFGHFDDLFLHRNSISLRSNVPRLPRGDAFALRSFPLPGVSFAGFLDIDLAALPDATTPKNPHRGSLGPFCQPPGPRALRRRCARLFALKALAAEPQVEALFDRTPVAPLVPVPCKPRQANPRERL